MAKIQLLPESLVNQIAAGEVVERPASVVKELCENSLDAGAKAIRVELEEGGRRRIAIADDGCGMSPEDARLALERHATSKLRDAEGLARIATLGFRGEALPAIASVSRFTLTTREPVALEGARFRLEGGRASPLEAVGAPSGTAVAVEDLFFNTPARQKFLKRDETEMSHCSEAVTRLALARPDVAFTLTHNGKTVFSAQADEKDGRERVASALGREVFRHLLPVQLNAGAARVWGYGASPDHSLSTAKGIYTFVNGRFVRDRGLIAACQRAYSNTLPAGRQPAAVLFIEMPLDQVDVNVHPQKLEVRFAEPRAIHDVVYQALTGMLRGAPWLKSGPSSSSIPPAGAEQHRARVEEALARYAARSSPALPFGPQPGWNAPAIVAPGAQSLAVGMEEGAMPPKGYFGSLRVIGQLAATYIVCEAPGGSLVLIDQHAAHERLKFDQLRKAHRERKPLGQPFLFPASLELPLAEARALAGHLDDVREMGFDLEPFGGTSFALKAVPAPLAGIDYRRLLLDLAQELMEAQSGRAHEEAMVHLLATMACHAAVRAHQALSHEEARALLDSLDQADFKARCPHGRPVAAEISLHELEAKVGRR